jgi:hypothetical protein
LLQANDLDSLRELVLARWPYRDQPEPEGGRVERLRRKLLAQPLHRLPGRLLRSGRRRLLSAFRAVPPPWEPTTPLAVPPEETAGAA